MGFHYAGIITADRVNEVSVLNGCQCKRKHAFSPTPFVHGKGDAYECRFLAFKVAEKLRRSRCTSKRALTFILFTSNTLPTPFDFGFVVVVSVIGNVA